MCIKSRSDRGWAITSNAHEQEIKKEIRDMDAENRMLHQLSKNWHMLSQDISSLSAQLQFLQSTYSQYMKLLGPDENNWLIDAVSNTNESFEALASRCEIFGGWVSNYLDRTNIRINLVRDLHPLLLPSISRSRLMICSPSSSI
jgi:hypothetical protein